ncbi:MFS transporter [Zeimonas arvi]|uniref:MFS transporter n=1 Tax=Zeimonas arvi TaxID=2498847 RepID=A0A5C8NU36_9BURK|nr:MFS transporter [Zeimonas arvi]TXL64671.1 MFS transporter [Zeimonas arvi]
MTHPAAALASTLAIQTLASLVATAPSVLAPVVAPSLGFGAERVGLFVGLTYLTAMLSGLASGAWVARFGAVRVSQAAMLACALATLAALAGSLLPLALAALALGTGYGIINPAASTLLARHAPAARRGLFFSIKQTGVPLGVASAGLLMPLGLHALGWRPSVVLAGAACAALALALRPLVAKLDPPRAAAGDPPASRSWRAGLATVIRDPALRTLSLASFAFAFTQLCFTTFLVSYLHLELGQPLSTAAAVLAGSQLVSTASRIGWGHVADRWVAPGILLGALGLAMALACAGLALLGESAGIGLIVAAAVCCAATVMGWNGVFFAELARQSSRADMATLAGASQFVTFFGSMSGPVIFAELIRNGGSYGGAYLMLGVLPALAGAAMLRAARRDRA